VRKRPAPDALHMDNHGRPFRAQLSLGPDVVKMARAAVKIPLDTHLMVTHPQHLTGAFIKAGASPLLIHIEAQCDVRAVLQDIRRHGVRPGLTLTPRRPSKRCIHFGEVTRCCHVGASGLRRTVVHPAGAAQGRGAAAARAGADISIDGASTARRPSRRRSTA